MVLLDRWIWLKVTILPRDQLPIHARRAFNALVKPAVPVHVHWNVFMSLFFLTEVLMQSCSSVRLP